MPKRDGIVVSPKYGLNPSLDLCFWCGKPRGVAIVGRLRKDGDNDAPAPKEMVRNIEPCDECKKKFAKGVLLIEVQEDGSKFGNNPAFALRAHKLMWPTGRWALLKPGSILKESKAGHRILTDHILMDEVFNANKAGEPITTSEAGK